MDEGAGRLVVLIHGAASAVSAGDGNRPFAAFRHDPNLDAVFNGDVIEFPTILISVVTSLLFRTEAPTRVAGGKHKVVVTDLIRIRRVA